ncbi:hypothetical protein ACP26L_08665 [Paenibacillus sp. S-38]|uniref:hypothetical protein n=1 Tax=Paenibacillus sp. S-38 TaxID=3416710 RepID=UPI003CFAC1F9
MKGFVFSLTCAAALIISAITFADLKADLALSGDPSGDAIQTEDGVFVKVPALGQITQDEIAFDTGQTTNHTKMIINANGDIYIKEEAAPTGPIKATREETLTPARIDKEWKSAFCCQSTETRTFHINEGSGHVKLFIQNKSSTELSYNVQHRESGMVYSSGHISGGGHATWLSWEKDPQGVRTGDYHVIFSGGNNDVSGEYWGQAASLLSEIQVN